MAGPTFRSRKCRAYPPFDQQHRDKNAVAFGVPVERDLFVEIMASYPAGVAVVTTLDVDGTPKGLTTTAVSSVSAEPPLLLVCVDLKSRTLRRSAPAAGS
jgi:flavin reductase (DIM6/NTAB) family NADH-FMN oxidoreductase RutF